MISIQSHISKLEALNKYMDCWIAMYNYRLVVEAYLKIGYLIPHAEQLPNFEEWYQLYQSVNN